MELHVDLLGPFSVELHGLARLSSQRLLNHALQGGLMFEQDPAELASQYFARQDYSRALFYLQQASSSQPRNPQYLNGMVNCYLQLGDIENAARITRKILKIDKKNDALYFQLSQLQFELGDVEGTIAACERAIDINPREYEYYLYLADFHEKANQYDRALDVLSQGLRHFPDAAALQIVSARCERRLGKLRESFRRLQKLGEHEAELSPHWRIQYHFEMGFVEDKRDKVDSAFHHFSLANEYVRSGSEYRDLDNQHSKKLIRGLTNLDFARVNEIVDVSRQSPPPLQPVFFVGFPRSGTTLLEKVLDSHPGINVIEEDNPLGRVNSIVEREPEKYFDSPFLLQVKNIESLRQIYYNEAAKHVSIDDGRLVVDKLPMNIVQIHIIKVLFPDARILLGLRHPCDSILSCFMQNFGVNLAMASMFEFESIVDYYNETMNLWHLFESQMDVASHSVRYEDLIEDMEGEVRNLLRFLDLPWDDDVLNYRQNAFKRGFIKTPSYSQVVRPLYKEARYRWHRYASFFEPWFDCLQPHCKAFGYSLELPETGPAEPAHSGRDNVPEA